MTTLGLVDLIDAYKGRHGVPDAELARRIGISRQNLHQWRTAGLRALPDRSNLEAVAAVIGRPYRDVLEGALSDIGYLAPGFSGPRTYGDVFADAVRSLTEAARLTDHRVRRTATGEWEPDLDTPGDPIDWAAFVTAALTSAAANIGSIDAVLAGRPGSWEADGVRALLAGAVGEDGVDLLRHRTDPIEIVVDPEVVLDECGDPFSELYDAAESDVDARIDAITVVDTDAGTGGEEGELPAWATGARDDPVLAAQYEQWVRSLPPPTPEQQAAEDAIAALLDIKDKLDAQRRTELEAYGSALRGAIEQRLGTLGLTVPVTITVQVEQPGAGVERVLPVTSWMSDNPVDVLVEEAIDSVPRPNRLPGSPLSRLDNPRP